MVKENSLKIIHLWGRMKVLATLKPQGQRVERGDSRQCNHQDKGAWMLVKMKIIGFMLETTTVHSMSPLCLRNYKLFMGTPTVT